MTLFFLKKLLYYGLKLKECQKEKERTEITYVAQFGALIAKEWEIMTVNFLKNEIRVEEVAERKALPSNPLNYPKIQTVV